MSSGPAARIGDPVVCVADIHVMGPSGPAPAPPAPPFTVPVPFPVIGQITKGADRTYIEGAKAAREDDEGTHSVCPGPNKFKITGFSDKVKIEGKWAARAGDKTKHCWDDLSHVDPSEGVILSGAFRTIIY